MEGHIPGNASPPPPTSFPAGSPGLLPKLVQHQQGWRRAAGMQLVQQLCPCSAKARARRVSQQAPFQLDLASTQRCFVVPVVAAGLAPALAESS